MANFGMVKHDFVDIDPYKEDVSKCRDFLQALEPNTVRMLNDLVSAINIDGNTQGKVEVIERGSKKPTPLNGMELKSPVKITDGGRITHIFAYKDGMLGIVKNGKNSKPIDMEEWIDLFLEGVVCDGESSCALSEYIRQYQDYMKSHEP